MIYCINLFFITLYNGDVKQKLYASTVLIEY